MALRSLYTVTIALENNNIKMSVIPGLFSISCACEDIIVQIKR